MSRLRRLLLSLALAAACVPAAADFADRNMVQGRVRSDLAPGVGAAAGADLQLDYRAYPQGCTLPDDGFFGCPANRWAPDKSYGLPGWYGLQSAPACRGNATVQGDTWSGCVRWPQANHFSMREPADSYWVAVANSDPAFDQCNSGPPGSSEPIVDPMSSTPTYYAAGLYKLAMEPKGDGTHRLHLILNPGEHSFWCQARGQYHYKINFLSVGAEKGRGQYDRLAWMYRGTYGPQVGWVGAVPSYQPFGCSAGKEAACPYREGQGYVGGVMAGFYATAAWGGQKRMVMVLLADEGVLAWRGDPPMKRHWNWPVRDSFYYPGSDLAYLTAEHLRTRCGMAVPNLQLSPVAQPFQIDATRLFACASDLGLFTTPMPSAWVELTGFHWFAEQAGTAGHLWLSVESPQIN